MSKPSGGQRGHPPGRRPGGKSTSYSQRLVTKSVSGARAEALAAAERRSKADAEVARAKDGKPSKSPGHTGSSAGGGRSKPARHIKHGSQTKVQAPVAPSGPSEEMRIAKAMARAGLCSRREAERWIADGRVNVNGSVLTTPAFEVKPGDRILVDGEPLPSAAPAQLWRYHKPRGLVTTHSDPQGRPTVFERLPPDLPRVVSIGRLDFNTEGLLLLTNDGELARHLELPATGWLRRYKVRAHGRVSQADLDTLKDGVTVDGLHYGPIEATIDSVQAGNMWLNVSIREGKNREVRKILESLNLAVNRLIRVSYGPFQLKDLAPGQAEVVKRRVLADQLGREAERFGLTGAVHGFKAEQGRRPGGAAKSGRRGDEDDDA